MSDKKGNHRLVVLDCPEKYLDEVRLEIPALGESAHLIDGLKTRAALVPEDDYDHVGDASHKYPIPTYLPDPGLWINAPATWLSTDVDLKEMSDLSVLKKQSAAVRRLIGDEPAEEDAAEKES